MKPSSSATQNLGPNTLKCRLLPKVNWKSGNGEKVFMFLHRILMDIEEGFTCIEAFPGVGLLVEVEEVKLALTGHQHLDSPFTPFTPAPGINSPFTLHYCGSYSSSIGL